MAVRLEAKIGSCTNIIIQRQQQLQYGDIKLVDVSTGQPYTLYIDGGRLKIAVMQETGGADD